MTTTASAPMLNKADTCALKGASVSLQSPLDAILCRTPTDVARRLNAHQAAQELAPELELELELEELEPELELV